MTSSPTPPISSQPTRSRTSSELLVPAPQVLHRPHTGRIQRSRSTSSRLLSIRNQEAIWETATGRNWASIEQQPSPEQSLPEFITPLSLSVAEIRAATSSPSVISAPVALRPLEEEANLEGPATSTPEPGIANPSLRCVSRLLQRPWRNPNGFASSMEFMMPPQYPHYGSHSSSYQSSEWPSQQRDMKVLTALPGYLDQYSGAEQERTYAHASPQPSSYAPSSYAASSAIVGNSPALSPRGGSAERESTSGHHYSSAVRSPYETSTSSAQAGYAYGSTSQTALQYGSTSYST
jgi:hypothetical protein